MKRISRSKKHDFLSSFFSFARVDLRAKGVYTRVKYTIRPKRRILMAKKFIIPFLVACMIFSACASSMVPVDNNEATDNFVVDLVSSVNLNVGSSELTKMA